jgi:predicted  nucleic acid-binding Zn-ribbon protein
VAGLTTIFKNDPEESQDTDKLVDLFKNRVELKKAFAALRNEKYRLQDRVKEHQGSIERVQQKLNHLENLLLDPEWVHNVVVFYQMRRLAAHCETKVARFAEQLKQHREQRVYDKLLLSCERQHQEDISRAEHRLHDYRSRLELLEDQLDARRDALQTMGSISKMLHGRSREASIDEIQTSIAALRKKEGMLLVELDRIEKRELPAHLGLDTAAKRSINFMILALVQQVYLDYVDDDLVSLAKEAGEKSVGAVNYGSKSDCDKLLKKLARRRCQVERERGDSESPEILQKRARLIADHALFRTDDDTVPIPGTVATVYDIDKNGLVRPFDANLLGENYFGVSKVLSA